MAQAQAQTQLKQRTIGALQIAIIVLTIITALVHLQRGIGMGSGFGGQGGPPPGIGQQQGNGQAPQGQPPADANQPGGGQRGQGGPPPGGGGGFALMRMLPVPLPTLFLLNGIGYLVLLVALYLPALRNWQRAIRWLLIAFTAVTIVSYFLFNGFRFNPIGYLDKLVEVALIACLFIEDRRATKAATAPALTS